MPCPASPTCVLFDFDGVCADTEPFGLEIDRKAFAAFGIEATDEELQSLVGTTGIESVPAVFAAHGMKVSAKKYFKRRGDNSWIYREAPIEASPGVCELLGRLHSQGIRTGLVSTTSSMEILFALNRLGLASCFDTIVTGDLVARRKPDPTPYLEALRYLGADATGAVAIEDSPTGIASAKAAGLYVLGYAGGQLVQDTSAADETVTGFHELFWPSIEESLEGERG